MCLEEEGIYTCYNLANHDFIPLLIKTSYSARQLVDWILQARLCEYVGVAIKDLRELGIRRITDLQDRSDITELAKETTATESSLKEAQRWIEKNEESLKRLLAASEEAGRHLTDEEPNVTLVKQFYRALRAGNVAVLLEYCAEDATWMYPIVDGVSYSTLRQGKSEIEDFEDEVWHCRWWKIQKAIH